MTRYPEIVTPGKNPLLPSLPIPPTFITPWYTLTLLDSFRQYNNAIEVNYLALEVALAAIVDIMASHVGTGGSGLSAPITTAEKAVLIALIQAVGEGIEDPNTSPGGPLRPALTGAKLTTQTIEDITTGLTSLDTFSDMM